MLKEFLIVSLFLFIAGIVWNLIKKNDLEMLPSFLWLLLMVVPFWFQFDSIPEGSPKMIQTFAIVFIGLCLFAGDSIRIKGVASEVKAFGKWEEWSQSYWLYAVLFLVFAIYHLSLLSHIPLIEKYVYGVTSVTELSEMREKTSKLLSIPSIIKHAFNWAINIFAPLAIVLAARKKKIVFAVVFFGIASFYAAMSLAKTQIVFLLVVFSMCALFRLSYSKRIRAYLVAFLFLIPVFWDGYSFLTKNPLSVINWKASEAEIKNLNLADQDPRSYFTPGDHARLAPLSLREELNVRERTYDYYFYRVFLAPADVASRWYQYFPERSNGFIGLQGLTSKDRDRSGQTHPARLVGHWAYTERFPIRYLETVQAYSSIDADAYARFGIVGVVLVGLIAIGLRLALKWFRDDSAFSETLYVIALVLSGLWWSSASLQALLVAQGVFPILAVLFIRYCARMNFFRVIKTN